MSAPGEIPEYPMEVDALVPTHPQRGAIYEADARTRFHTALLDEHIKKFQAFVSAQVEQYHDGDHLGIGDRAVPIILPAPLVSLGRKAVDLAEVIRYTENFRN